MVHNRTSGVAHFLAEDEQGCMQLIKKLLSFLPSNNADEPPIVKTGDDPNRMDESIAKIIPVNPQKPYDMRDVILRVVDNGDFLEVQPYFAQNMVIGFARLDGRTAGIIANQPKVLAGCLDINASDKAARFIRFCDAFNIPVVTFADCPAYLPGVNQEHGGIIRHGAKMLFAYAESTVPKVTLVVRKAYGGSLSGMCVSKDIGKDLTIALPTAEIAVMGPEAATDIVFKNDIAKAEKPDEERVKRIAEYREKFANPYVSAERMYVDKVIEPREIRPVLISSIRALSGKIRPRPPRKHGIIPV